MAGIPIREELEGISFAPLLSDCDREWKTAVFSQFLREGIWIAPDGVEYMGRCIRTERYRCVEWKKHGSDKLVARELYDETADPQENTNIADSPEHRELIAELATQLKSGWKSALPKTDR